MADQLSHENTTTYFEVEKESRATIQLARRVFKNKNCENPQLLSLEDPEATVIALAELACTLLEIAEDQGVTPDMVARLMGKRSGGRDKAVHRLLPAVKKEIKAEIKESKGAAGIARLNEKAHLIAIGKRHPKAKGKGKGPKSGRSTNMNSEDAASQAAQDDGEHAVEHEDESEGAVDSPVLSFTAE